MSEGSDTLGLTEDGNLNICCVECGCRVEGFTMRLEDARTGDVMCGKCLFKLEIEAQLGNKECGVVE
ncbi:MAG: hypothetical protein KAS32_27000 [Candidatus Peribacteraceae bacterium]|nr:hypothetical protein [Candidatus Peribacteraceae bacterium]